MSQTNWARDFSQGLISPKQLLENKLIREESLKELEEIKDNFDIRIPKIFIEQIKKENPALIKQFIPTKNELIFFPEELKDPISDEKWTPVEGITHRYPDRVLLKPTYMCSVYCRFCFRRYKVSQSKYNLKEDAYIKAIEYIKTHKEIWEVILTGGDPLVLTDNALKKIMDDISKIDHVKIIRFHTRVPSALPLRINENLIKILTQTNKSVWIAVHMNNADEFTPESKIALSKLNQAGVGLLLQSVLLKDVNDTTIKLIALLKTAVENKLKPYYLHYPDLAKGTEHFRIPLKKAIELVKSLRGQISGLCIPQFIVDIPQGKGKITVNTHSAIELNDNTWEFESPIDGSKVVVSYPTTIKI